MEDERTVLVVGATGKQGRSTVKFLLGPDRPASPGIKFKVLALTRDTSSESARQLLERNKQHVDNFTLVQGDLDKPDSIRNIFQDAASSDNCGIWGVFVALAYPGLGESAKGEIQQAKVRFSVARPKAHYRFVDAWLSCSCWPTLPLSSRLSPSYIQAAFRLAPARMTTLTTPTVRNHRLKSIAGNWAQRA